MVVMVAPDCLGTWPRVQADLHHQEECPQGEVHLNSLLCLYLSARCLHGMSHVVLSSLQLP